MEQNSPSGYIQFRYRYIRKTGKYSLEKLDVRQKRILERKLRDYEKHTVKSFDDAKGVGLHEVDFGEWKKAPSEHQERRVRKEISVEVPELGPVKRFRVSGKMRVLGYQNENLFFVVWVDPNHEMGG